MNIYEHTGVVVLHCWILLVWSQDGLFVNNSLQPSGDEKVYYFTTLFSSKGPRMRWYWFYFTVKIEQNLFFLSLHNVVNPKLHFKNVIIITLITVIFNKNLRRIEWQIFNNNNIDNQWSETRMLHEIMCICCYILDTKCIIVIILKGNTCLQYSFNWEGIKIIKYWYFYCNHL